jgi:hypothetical protein
LAPLKEASVVKTWALPVVVSKKMKKGHPGERRIGALYPYRQHERQGDGIRAIYQLYGDSANRGAETMNC